MNIHIPTNYSINQDVMYVRYQENELNIIYNYLINKNINIKFMYDMIENKYVIRNIDTNISTNIPIEDLEEINHKRIIDKIEETL